VSEVRRQPPLEIEAKVPLEGEGFDGLRTRLREIGARLSRPRLREENTLFDFPDGRLEKADSALRVRSFGQECLLTYKGRSREHSFLKLREEIETRVEDAAALVELLQALGLRKAFHYWKYREIYDLEVHPGAVTIALDETPIGFFAEVEGPEESIQAVVDLMGWDPASFIRESYPKLYREHGLGSPGVE
jgi:adenylate cyclase class 2